MRALMRDNLDLNIAELLIVHKESFDLFQYCLVEVVDFSEVGIQQGLPGCRKEPVIAICLAIPLLLFRLDHADQRAFQNATGECRLLNKYKHVAIAILSFRGMARIRNRKETSSLGEAPIRIPLHRHSIS